MRVCLTLPIYLRGKSNNRVTGLAIRHYASFGWPLHVCGSEGSLSADYVQPYLSDKVKYIEVPQERFSTASNGDYVLRKKFNDSIETHGHGYDWYCMMGADDFVPRLSYDFLTDTEQPTMAGVGIDQPFYIYEMATKRGISVSLTYSNRLNLLPGLNAFNAPAMKICDWKPYHLSGCETGAELYFKEFGDVCKMSGHVVNIKEGKVLNDFSKVKRVHNWTKITQSELDVVNSYL